MSRTGLLQRRRMERRIKREEGRYKEDYHSVVCYIKQENTHSERT